MTNFLDISQQNHRPKPEIETIEDRLRHYLSWAPQILGHEVRAFSMTVPAFVRWYRFCEKREMDHQTYDGKQIVVDKTEQQLDVIAILI